MACGICDTSLLSLTSRWDYIMNWIMFVTIVSLNSIEIHILRKKIHRKGHEKILLSLSICDLSYQLVTAVFIIIRTWATATNSKQILQLLLSVYGFPILFANMVSILHLILMTLEKLWAIVAPLNHAAYASGRRINKMIFLSWFISFVIILSCIVVIIWKELTVSEIIAFHHQKIVKIVVYMMIVGNAVFVVSYSVIFWTIYSRPHNVQIAIHRSVKMSTVMLCVGIVLSLSLSTAPFVVVHVVKWNAPQPLVQAGYSLIPVNAATNSIVFLISHYCKKRSKHIIKGQNPKVEAQHVELHAITSIRYTVK